MALAPDSTMANRTRNQLSTDSLDLFPNNNSQLITPQDLRDWITNGIENQKIHKNYSIPKGWKLGRVVKNNE